MFGRVKIWKYFEKISISSDQDVLSLELELRILENTNLES